jgi:glutathione synthase
MIRPGCAIRREDLCHRVPRPDAETLISRDPATINAFRAEVGDMILKPLYGNGGAGVFHVKPDDRNMSSLLEMFAQMYREPFIAQEYLSDVRGRRQAHHPDRRRAGQAPSTGCRPSMIRAPTCMSAAGRAQRTDGSRKGNLRPHRAVIEGARLHPGRHRHHRRQDDRDQRHLADGLREIRNFGGPDVAALFWDAVESKRAHS